MIKNKNHEDNDPLKLLQKFLYIEAEKLGIHATSNVERLNVESQSHSFILFASTPDTIKGVIKGVDDINYPKNIEDEVKYLISFITYALENSNKKIILVVEWPFELSSREYLKEMLKIVRKMGDRFEIKQIGLSQNTIKSIHSVEEFEKYRRWYIVEQARDLFKKYKDTDTIIAFFSGTGIISVLDILVEMEKDIGDGEGKIKKEDIAKIYVLLPPQIKSQILPGGIGEFVHHVGLYSSIYLRIPLDEVKNIQSAIEKTENEGLKAKVIDSGGYRYLQIYKEGYDRKDDWKITEKLKKIAIEVSTEDYLDHIKDIFKLWEDEVEGNGKM